MMHYEWGMHIMYTNTSEGSPIKRVKRRPIFSAAELMVRLILYIVRNSRCKRREERSLASIRGNVSYGLSLVALVTFHIFGYLSSDYFYFAIFADSS